MKYYFLRGDKLEEIETRLTPSNLRELKPEYRSVELYEKKQDVPIPDGYKLTGDRLVKTADKIKQEADEEKKALKDAIVSESIGTVLLHLAGVDKSAELAEFRSRLEAIEKSDAVKKIK